MQTLRFNSRPLRFLSKIYTMFRVLCKELTNVAMLFGIIVPRLHLSTGEYYQPVISISPSYSNIKLQENLTYLLPRFACFHYNVATCQISAYNVMCNLIYTIDSQVYLDWLVQNTVGDYEEWFL